MYIGRKLKLEGRLKNKIKEFLRNCMACLIVEQAIFKGGTNIVNCIYVFWYILVLLLMSKLIYNHVLLDHLWHFNTLQKIQNKAVDDLYI